LHRTLPLIWGLAACGGVDQDEFVVLYTDHYCEAWLDCGVTATQQFDGTDSIEDCKALEASAVTGAWVGCKYKKGKAKQCLESLLPATCPTSGNLGDVFPPICEEVWVDCVGGSATSDDGE